jgi:hypothetical protein
MWFIFLSQRFTNHHSHLLINVPIKGVNHRIHITHHRDRYRATSPFPPLTISVRRKQGTLLYWYLFYFCRPVGIPKTFFSTNQIFANGLGNKIPSGLRVPSCEHRLAGDRPPISYRICGTCYHVSGQRYLWCYVTLPLVRLGFFTRGELLLPSLTITWIRLTPTVLHSIWSSKGHVWPQILTHYLSSTKTAH